MQCFQFMGDGLRCRRTAHDAFAGATAAASDPKPVQSLSLPALADIDLLALAAAGGVQCAYKRGKAGT